jgi:hypothetical protein
MVAGSLVQVGLLHTLDSLLLLLVWLRARAVVLGQKGRCPEANDHLVGQVVVKSLKRQTEGPQSEQSDLRRISPTGYVPRVGGPDIDQTELMFGWNEKR